MNRIITAPVLLCVLSYLLPASATGATIETVLLGNEGNANNPRDGDQFTAEAPHWGGVGYADRIGVAEVTVGQYCELLDAAAVTDTYALYNPAIATEWKLVEAAGIEPASAWCPASASTCVASARFRWGQSRKRGAAPT